MASGPPLPGVVRRTFSPNAGAQDCRFGREAALLLAAQPGGLSAFLSQTRGYPRRETGAFPFSVIPQGARRPYFGGLVAGG